MEVEVRKRYKQTVRQKSPPERGSPNGLSPQKTGEESQIWSNTHISYG